MEFIGFDGVSYSFPTLPDSISNYNHLIIAKYYTKIYLFPFNDNIEFFCSSYPTLKVVRDVGIKTDVFELKDGSWYSYDRLNQSYFNIPLVRDVSYIYISDGLMPYKEDILSSSLLNEGEKIVISPVLVSEDEVTIYTLRPILEDIEEEVDIYQSAYTEVFSILPLLLVVFISFIGIRKGLSFLFSFLKRS